LTDDDLWQGDEVDDEALYNFAETVERQQQEDQGTYNTGDLLKFWSLTFETLLLLHLSMYFKTGKKTFFFIFICYNLHVLLSIDYLREDGTVEEDTLMDFVQTVEGQQTGDDDNDQNNMRQQQQQQEQRGTYITIDFFFIFTIF